MFARPSRLLIATDLIFIGLSVVGLATPTFAVTAQAEGFGKSADLCLSVAEPTARVRCFGETLQHTVSSTLTLSQSIGKWRLLRSPHPRGGPTAISVMRTADLSASDPDFAGLMLRCGETGIEVLVVVITPFPPRARPKVTIKGADDVALDGTVVPPGSAILLPREATELANGAWQRDSAVTVAVTRGNERIRGVVSLDGLADAVQALRAQCEQQ